MTIDVICGFLNSNGFNYKVINKSDSSYDWFCDLHSLEDNRITWIKRIESHTFDERDFDKTILFITNDVPAIKYSKSFTFIVCDNPKAVFFEIIRHFFYKNKSSSISHDSIIETTMIGNNVSIGHNCYICKDVEIGSGVIIKNNVVIECNTKIGDNCVVGSGTIIGGEGFGYYSLKGVNKKVPDFGGVILEDDVEIGSNVCIDRGTLGNTIIKKNSKIDNLCHIAHNVVIDENCLITASSVIAGSTHLEKNVYIAPGSLIINQIVVGEDSLIGMGAVVTKPVEKNKVMAGVPAKAIRDNK